MNGWNEESQRYRVFLDPRLGDTKVKVIAVKEHCLKEKFWINQQPFMCFMQNINLNDPNRRRSTGDDEPCHSQLATTDGNG